MPPGQRRALANQGAAAKMIGKSLLQLKNELLQKLEASDVQSEDETDHQDHYKWRLRKCIKKRIHMKERGCTKKW
jgi:hypothetical protein